MAEGACYSLALKDRENYGKDIYISGTEETPFYTNSTALPVDYTNDVIEAIAHQTDLQDIYSSGTVFHVFLGEKQPDPKAIGKFIINVFKNYKLPYMSITPTFSHCRDHGYSFGEGCSHEGCTRDDVKIYSRVVGYTTAVNGWNKGKKVEFEQRKSFNI